MENKEEDGHLLVRGDTVDAMEEFVADESVDLVFADPPYNIGKNFNGRIDRMAETEYIEWSYSWLSVCVRKLKPTGSMYVMTSTQFMPYFDLFLRDKVQILSRIIWSYDSSGVQARKYYGSMYEPILFAVKDPAKYTFNAKDIKVAARTGSVRKLIDYRKDPPQPYSNDNCAKRIPCRLMHARMQTVACENCGDGRQCYRFVVHFHGDLPNHGPMSGFDSFEDVHFGALGVDLQQIDGMDMIDFDECGHR